MKMAEIPPKWTENTVGNGEVARYETTSPLPTIFSKVESLKLQKHKTQGLFGKGLTQISSLSLFTFNFHFFYENALFNSTREVAKC